MRQGKHKHKRDKEDKDKKSKHKHRHHRKDEGTFVQIEQLHLDRTLQLLLQILIRCLLIKLLNYIHEVPRIATVRGRRSDLVLSAMDSE